MHLFPELFTQENLHKQYNCSGSLGKKQLDPARIRLICSYVQLLYPRAKKDRGWTLEFVGKLDELFATAVWCSLCRREHWKMI